MWWWLAACGTDVAERPAPVPVPEAPVVAQPAPPAPTAKTGVAEPFGAYPLCEPSAAIDLDDGSTLVADNEGRPADSRDREDARPTLWVVPNGGVPVPVSREEVGQDSESLVRLGDELWVMGSLSRNKSCEVRGKRWEVHVAKPSAFTAAGLARIETSRVLERKTPEIEKIEGSEADCRALLFGGLPESAAVCAAIVAGAAGPAGQPCDALNVEGAAAIDGRVWVGLRSPVVEGSAILARVAAGHDAIAFDAIRRLDLGGLGVRELVVRGDRLYGIAGTELDASAGETSKLFSVPLAGLASGELPVEILDPSLPPSAESFRLGEGEVTYFIDGSTGDAVGRCAQPAQRIVRPTPSVQ